MAVVAAASAAAATGGLMVLTQDEPIRPAAAAQQIELPPRTASTGERLEGLRAALRTRPRSVDGHVLLAAAELQGVRESGDPAGYTRAERAIARALELRPGDQGALTERAQLALARHDFRAGLRDATAARRADPSVIRPYGPLVDAHVELG